MCIFQISPSAGLFSDSHLLTRILTRFPTLTFVWCRTRSSKDLLFFAISSFHNLAVFVDEGTKSFASVCEKLPHHWPHSTANKTAGCQNVLLSIGYVARRKSRLTKHAGAKPWTPYTYQRQILIKILFVGFCHFCCAFRPSIFQSSFVNYYATVHMRVRKEESKKGEIFFWKPIWKNPKGPNAGGLVTKPLSAGGKEVWGEAPSTLRFFSFIKISTFRRHKIKL